LRQSFNTRCENTSLDTQHTRVEVDVPAFEREQLLGPWAGADQHDRDRSEPRVHLRADRLHSTLDRRAGVPDPCGRVRVEEAHRDGVLEHLPERLEHVVRRPCREL
jgi:hypothetical protein